MEELDTPVFRAAMKMVPENISETSVTINRHGVISQKTHLLQR
jgi:hypothetical protein